MKNPLGRSDWRRGERDVVVDKEACSVPWDVAAVESGAVPDFGVTDGIDSGGEWVAGSGWSLCGGVGSSVVQHSVHIIAAIAIPELL